MIILVQNLTEFVFEAPPPRTVRLSLRNGTNQSQLDLQARPEAGLVWLCDWYTHHAPAEIHRQLNAALPAIAAWLVDQGYDVRPGRWATPDNYRPDRGRFEIIKWMESAGNWQLVIMEECDDHT
jgi:hypothetical protein